MADHSFIFPFNTLQNEFWKAEKNPQNSAKYYVLIIILKTVAKMAWRRENKVEKEHLMNQYKMLQFQKLHHGKVFSFPLVLRVVSPPPCCSGLTLIQRVSTLFRSQTTSQEKERNGVVFYESLHHWEGHSTKGFPVCSIWSVQSQTK